MEEGGCEGLVSGGGTAERAEEEAIDGHGCRLGRERERERNPRRERQREMLKPYYGENGDDKLLFKSSSPK